MSLLEIGKINYTHRVRCTKALCHCATRTTPRTMDTKHINTSYIPHVLKLLLNVCWMLPWRDGRRQRRTQAGWPHSWSTSISTHSIDYDCTIFHTQALVPYRYYCRISIYSMYLYHHMYMAYISTNETMRIVQI